MNDTINTASILYDIKAQLGYSYDYTEFDHDIIFDINAVFFNLKQIGVGDTFFQITGSSETWSDFLDDAETLAMVRSYVYLKVRLVFDPPTSSILMESLKAQIAETEWRLHVSVDPGEEEET